MFFFMCVLMFVGLTAASLYLRVNHRENRLINWATLVILCAGLGGLQILLEKGWVPYAVSHELNATLVRTSILLTALLNTAVQTFPYYGMLVFYLIYNGVYTHQRWIPILTSVPPLWTLFFQTDLIGNRVDTGFVAVWGLCYLLFSLGLAVRPIIQTKDAKERLQHIGIGLIFLLPLSIFNLYQFSSSSVSDHLISIIPYVCLTSILFIGLIYLRDVFLGVRKKSVHTVHIGTGLIHHSLKNMIGKVKLNALNIRKNVQQGQYDEIEDYVDNLLKTHETMMAMMAKISSATSDKLEPKMELADLSLLLDEVLRSVEVHPQVQVVKEYGPESLYIDKMLITECLQNICNNAVEAMGERGWLYVGLERRKNKVLLSIRDTGKGMNSIQVQNVFEPFYSTKYRSGKHFGLGMYQVKKVMEAHKGKVEVRSTPNKGTVIVLSFQKKVEFIT